MGANKKLYGYYPTDEEWLPLKIDSSGRVILSSLDWIISGETWTYDSADDPTFTFTVSGDKREKYSAGMRIRLKQGGAYLYFIITQILYADPDTTITIYGGTGYNLIDTAITDNYYSFAKAPLGFPLEPTVWTVEVIDTTQRHQAAPTQNTWYNLGNVSITIPIGAWKVQYTVITQMNEAVANTYALETTLSTANNSESDNHFSVQVAGYCKIVLVLSVIKEKNLNLASKTTYYLNTRTINANIDRLYNRGELIPTIIRAICNYL